MSEGNKPNLRPIWDAILEVYKVFAAICDKHGLRYCADTGTALGAVRHGGFIPWDDDMDIQMPRPDYEKFVEIAPKELPAGLAWLDRFNCKDFHWLFGKIIVVDAELVNRISRESGLPLGQGVFIDIFPVDGYPDTFLGKLWRRMQNALILLMEIHVWPWKFHKSVLGKLVWLFGFLLKPFFPKIHSSYDCRLFFDRRARKLAFGESKMCASIGLASYYDDKPFPYACYGKLKKIPFDRMEMVVHEHVEEYLIYMFGNYKELPPESKRGNTHATAEYAKWRLGPVSDFPS